jgi:hypothetical protein
LSITQQVNVICHKEYFVFLYYYLCSFSLHFIWRLIELEQKIMATLPLMVEWFSANKLAVNISKTNILRFSLKQSLNSLAVTSGNLSLNEIPVTKFLGLQIDKSLDWKSHVEYILPELSTAIFAIRTLSYFSSKQILWMVYFSYFHSILRIMSGMSPRDSCRDLFRKLQILPLSCEYILSLMLFVIDNQTKFCSVSDFHGLNTRNREQLCLPNANLSVRFEVLTRATRRKNPEDTILHESFCFSEGFYVCGY